LAAEPLISTQLWSAIIDSPLSKLTEIVPPPKKPKGVGTAAQWSKAESELGISLPDDYRQFIETYGSGLFAGFYVIYSPGEKSPYSNLVKRQKLMQPIYESHEDRPYAVHPERPGLLVWGADENGNYYYWLTKGTPDKWTVVAEHGREEEFDHHKCSMVKFLLGVQQLKIRALAKGYPPLIMRCPNEGCCGWALGSHGDNDEWHCEACAYDWSDRASFEEAIAEAIEKHAHRRACYVKKKGHFYPADREKEPSNYKKLVSKEFDE